MLDELIFLPSSESPLYGQFRNWLSCTFSANDFLRPRKDDKFISISNAATSRFEKCLLYFAKCCYMFKKKLNAMHMRLVHLEKKLSTYSKTLDDCDRFLIWTDVFVYICIKQMLYRKQSHKRKILVKKWLQSYMYVVKVKTKPQIY